MRNNRGFLPFERLPSGVSLPFTFRRYVPTFHSHQQRCQAVLFAQASVQPEVLNATLH